MKFEFFIQLLEFHSFKIQLHQIEFFEIGFSYSNSPTLNLLKIKFSEIFYHLFENQTS